MVAVVSREVAGNFVQTWSSASQLSLKAVGRSQEVLILLVLLLITMSGLAMWGLMEDHKSLMNRTLSAVSQPKSNVSNLHQLKLSGQMLLDNVLPSMLRESPFWKRAVEEVKQNHKWAGVVYHSAGSWSRFKLFFVSTVSLLQHQQSR